MFRTSVLAGLLLIAASVGSCGPPPRSDSRPNPVQASASPTVGASGGGPRSSPEGHEQASLPSLAPDGPSAEGAPGTSSAPGLAQSGKVNLNAATRDELQKIPNINEQAIQVILDDQPFISISHFRRAVGKLVAPDRVATYEKHLFVPVDPNGADTETLRQLPGVDLQIAIQLGRARPFASVDAFLLKLGEMVSPADLEAGRPWVFTW